MARPARPMFAPLPPAGVALPAADAAADGCVSVAEARSRYLGGMSKTAFYALVRAGEIELVHEGRKPAVPVRQLVLRLARKIEEGRAAGVGAHTGRAGRKE